MSESKRASAENFEQPMSPDDIGFDPDDAPELDDEWFERADLSIAGKLVQRGHRPGETERLVLPTEIVERFRAHGPGWQIRIEDALKEWMAEHPERL
ncbi:hypothetical protein CHKEEEPN_4584 [Methylorubrum podarium]|jgi:uncharacterized protein (DUF4415 family)|nr:hypothetical protein CHKEEEPN_4584 [Methylorubrum podarium]